jgi:hypothetical protein
MQPRHKKPLRAFKCRRPLLCWNATPDTATPAMSQFVLDDHLDVHEVRRPIQRVGIVRIRILGRASPRPAHVQAFR